VELRNRKRKSLCFGAFKCALKPNVLAICSQTPFVYVRIERVAGKRKIAIVLEISNRIYGFSISMENG
jgi:hypothetical protein